MELYAVIPSGNRLAELTALVKVLAEDGVNVIVVNTGYEYDEISQLGTPDNQVYIYNATREPKNISAWWNHGLRWAEQMSDSRGNDEYVVAVLNDDIVIKSGFVHELAAGIFRHDVVLSYPDVFGLQFDQDFHQPSHWRMSGYAFALRGSAEIYANETLQWWYGDNDIEWQAFAKGGTVLIAAATCGHLYPNQSTVGPLAEQAGRDRETFRAKWGRYAW